MGKATERDVAEFALDISKRLHEIYEVFFNYWGENWILFLGKFRCSLADIFYSEWTADVLLDLAATAFYDDVKEHTGNEHCVAYLSIEGYLFEKIYYHPLREDSQKYIEAFDTAAKDHNMRYDFTSGALIFYDIDDTDAGVIGKLFS